MTGNWTHDRAGILDLDGQSPIKLRFELIDPSGTVVKTAVGSSSKEARKGFPRFNLVYRVVGCDGYGPWKVRITNMDTNDGVPEVSLVVKFTAACPH